MNSQEQLGLTMIYFNDIFMVIQYSRMKRLFTLQHFFVCVQHKKKCQTHFE